MGKRKARYLLNEEYSELIKSKYRNSFFVERIGISRNYVSRIINRNLKCSYMVAYCITKCVNNELEVKDIFEEV